MDSVSKNGNLFLNIGPRADGTITGEETRVRLGTGQWPGFNDEAIYRSCPWKLYCADTIVLASDQFGGQKLPFNSKDIRFMLKRNTFYAITLALPVANETVMIKSRGQKRETVCLCPPTFNWWAAKKDFAGNKVIRP